MSALSSVSGLPATAFRCLIAHADNDPHHIADLNRTLDSMPLTAEQQKYIALSAFQTIDAVAAVFEEMLDLHNTSGQSKLGTLTASYG